MKTKIYRATENTHKKLVKECYELSNKEEIKVSESMLVNWALNYCIDRKLFRSKEWLKELSTGKGLQER